MNIELMETNIQMAVFCMLKKKVFEKKKCSISFISRKIKKQWDRIFVHIDKSFKFGNTKYWLEYGKTDILMCVLLMDGISWFIKEQVGNNN